MAGFMAPRAWCIREASKRSGFQGWRTNGEMVGFLWGPVFKSRFDLAKKDLSDFFFA